MTRIRTSLAAGLVAVVAATAFAASAGAKDWVSAFPSGSDVMPALGKYEAKPMIDAGPMPKGGWYPCEAFTVPSSKTIVTATYIPKSKTEKSLGIRSYVYASDAKAKAAFAVIQKKLSSCDGTSEFTSSESGPNTTRRTVTTGVDSNIEITGTEALYVYARDVPIAGVGNAARDAGGEYTLYVLANNTIMETGASQSGKVGYTSSQKAAVEELASAATETWGNAGN